VSINNVMPSTTFISFKLLERFYSVEITSVSYSVAIGVRRNMTAD